MKNLKLYTLATILAFVLVAGQPHAVVASVSNSNSSGFELSSFDTETADFNVTISNVAQNLETLESSYTLDGTDTEVYEMVTPTTFPTVRVSVDISGYTMLENSTGDENPYMGHLYAIINGEVLQGTLAALSSSVTINLGLRDNTITYFYIGREADGSIVYDSDTIIVRVADTASDLATDIETVAVPVSFTATSMAASGDYDASDSLAYNYFTYYSLDKSVAPTYTDFDMTLSSADRSETTELDGETNVFVSERGLITIGGEYDASGYTGPQSKGYNFDTFEYDGDATHSRTDGHKFVSGVNGVTEIVGNSATVMLGSTSEDDDKIQSAFSAFVLSDFGYWDVEQDFYGFAGVDWDGLSSAFYGSVDFVSDEDISVMLTQTIILNVSETTTPGFGVVISLFSIGLIAYLAPRMRKD